MMPKELPDMLWEGAPDRPLSRLYHEQSKLGPWRRRVFAEQLQEYSADVEAETDRTAGKTYPTMPAVELPRSHRRQGGRRLRDVLRTRRSQREPWSGRPIRRRQLSYLLDAAAGITAVLEPPRPDGFRQIVRAWPSAGGLYSIELYPVVLRGADLEPGIHHFDPRGRRLTRIGPPGPITECIYADGLSEGASLLLLLTAVLARTQAKYGERGYRLALLDAGHLGQNLLLAAEDLRLGAVAIGGFDDDRLAELLQLDPAQEPPVHAVLIGSKR